MSDDVINCPQCNSPYAYYLSDQQCACPECGNEWDPELLEVQHSTKVLDVNGNTLTDGDAVIVIKDLPVKGASKPIKKGTKVKNIRIVDSDHNIDCKIDGFGKMALKSAFVRKA